MEVIPPTQEQKESSPENFLGKREDSASDQEEPEELVEACIYCYNHEGRYRCTGCHLKLCSPICISHHQLVKNPNEEANAKDISGRLPAPLNIAEYF